MPLIPEIPGLDEAIEREAFDRTAPFVEVSEEILGLKVQMLTPRLALELEAIGSPFFCGGVPTSGDLAEFLWHVGLDRLQPKPFWWTEGRFRNFQKQLLTDVIAPLDFVAVAMAIYDYIADANEDGPSPSGGVGAPPFASRAAGIVDHIASRYGWQESVILDIPYKRLWQYWRCCAMRDSGGEKTFVNRADKVRDEFLRKLNEKEAA